MKKIMSIMLGLSLLVGSAALTFGQEPKEGDKKGGKKGKGKGKGDDKDKAHRTASTN